MAVITIGAEVKNRAAGHGYNRTYLSVDGPANLTGILDTMLFYFHSAASGVKCGTFSGSSTSYDDRDYETIGNVTNGSIQSFTGLNCDVTASDLMGEYSNSGGIEVDYSGYLGNYYILEDTFGQGSHTYALWTGDAISIGGTGTTPDQPHFSYYPHILAH